MNYFVKRGDQEYGPYTLAALQQYVAQGSIARQDLARSEAMTDWMPVSEVLGNVQVPLATFGAATAPRVESLPPKLHWAVVLVLGIVTLGIFVIIWLFVQAAWIRKVRPQSRSLFYLIAYLAATFLGALIDGTMHGAAAIGQIAGLVLYLVAIFGMRSDIEEYYLTLNPVGLKLGGGMTFFFHAVYFQYHLNDIREEIETGRVAAATAGS